MMEITDSSLQQQHQAMTNRKLLADLTNEYKLLMDDYTLQGTRKQVLDNLVSEKSETENIEIIDISIQEELFSSKALELSNEIDSLNIANNKEENDDTKLDEHMQIELIHGENLLKKLREELAIVEALINSSQKQIDELNNINTESSKENCVPKNVNTTEVMVDDAKIRNIRKSHNE